MCIWQIAKSEDFKAQANKKFGANQFNEALALYSEAIESNPLNHILFANRAFCHIKLENYGAAPPFTMLCCRTCAWWHRRGSDVAT
ncbi:MAG: hypothetical protein ACPIOQ_72635 [Promethearchaeia archaeon]